MKLKRNRDLQIKNRIQVIQERYTYLFKLPKISKACAFMIDKILNLKPRFGLVFMKLNMLTMSHLNIGLNNGLAIKKTSISFC